MPAPSRPAVVTHCDVRAAPPRRPPSTPGHRRSAHGPLRARLRPFLGASWSSLGGTSRPLVAHLGHCWRLDRSTLHCGVQNEKGAPQGFPRCSRWAPPAGDENARKNSGRLFFGVPAGPKSTTFLRGSFGTPFWRSAPHRSLSSLCILAGRTNPPSAPPFDSDPSPPLPALLPSASSSHRAVWSASVQCA